MIKLLSPFPGVWAEDEVAALLDDLGGDLRVDGHVAHAEEEPARGRLGEGVVDGAPPAGQDPHARLVQPRVVAQDYLALR